MVGAKIGVGLHRSAIHMEGIDVGRHRPRIFIPRVPMNAVENRRKTQSAKSFLVFEKRGSGNTAVWAEHERRETRGVERGDSLRDAKLLHDLAEIAAQLARPAQGIDAVSKTPRDEFVEASHELHAGTSGKRGKKGILH
jgi:hypothetical protein